jgi:hypothetical protein
MGIVEELARLFELHKAGALTDHEFARAKEMLLGTERPPSPPHRFDPRTPTPPPPHSTSVQVEFEPSPLTFPIVVPGYAVTAAVSLMSSPVATQVRARITDDHSGGAFRVKSLVASVLVTVRDAPVDPSEGDGLPHPPRLGAPPPTTRKEPETVLWVAGTDLLTVGSGQIVDVNVECRGPIGGSTTPLTANLRIEADGWAPVTIPVKAISADVDVSVVGGVASLPVAQGSSNGIGIRTRLAGPATDVSFIRWPEVDGISMETVTVHVPAGGAAEAQLKFQASPGARAASYVLNTVLSAYNDALRNSSSVPQITVQVVPGEVEVTGPAGVPKLKISRGGTLSIPVTVSLKGSATTVRFALGVNEVPGVELEPAAVDVGTAGRQDARLVLTCYPSAALTEGLVNVGWSAYGGRRTGILNVFLIVTPPRPLVLIARVADGVLLAETNSYDEFVKKIGLVPPSRDSLKGLTQALAASGLSVKYLSKDWGTVGIGGTDVAFSRLPVGFLKRQNYDGIRDISTGIGGAAVIALAIAALPAEAPFLLVAGSVAVASTFAGAITGIGIIEVIDALPPSVPETIVPDPSAGPSSDASSPPTTIFGVVPPDVSAEEIIAALPVDPGGLVDPVISAVPTGPPDTIPGFPFPPT